METTKSVDSFSKLLSRLERSNDIVIFAGAGISRNVKSVNGDFLPDWKELFKKILVSEKVISHKDEFSFDELKSKINKLGDSNEKINKIKKKLRSFLEIDPQEYKLDQIRDFGKTLFKVCEGRIVTTNYDHFFEDFATKGINDGKPFEDIYAPGDNIDEVVDRISSNVPYILKLHGNPDTNAVLFDKDYLNFYGKSSDIRDIIFKNLFAKTILFLGFSLQDWDVLKEIFQMSEAKKSSDNYFFVHWEDNYRVDLFKGNKIMIPKPASFTEKREGLEAITSFLSQLLPHINKTTKPKSQLQQKLFSNAIKNISEANINEQLEVICDTLDVQMFDTIDLHEPFVKLYEKIKSIPYNPDSLRLFRRLKDIINEKGISEVNSNFTTLIEFILYKEEESLFFMEGINFDVKNLSQHISQLLSHKDKLCLYRENPKTEGLLDDLIASYNQHAKLIVDKILTIEVNKSQPSQPLETSLYRFLSQKVNDRYALNEYKLTSKISSVWNDTNPNSKNHKYKKISKDRRFFMVKEGEEYVGFGDYLMLSYSVYDDEFLRKSNLDENLSSARCTTKISLSKKIEYKTIVTYRDLLDALLSESSRIEVQLNYLNLEIATDIESINSVFVFSKLGSVYSYKSFFDAIPKSGYTSESVKVLREYYTSNTFTSFSPETDKQELFGTGYEKFPIVIQGLGYISYPFYKGIAYRAEYLDHHQGEDIYLNNEDYHIKFQKNSNMLLEENTNLSKIFDYFSNAQSEDFVWIKSEVGNIYLLYFTDVLNYISNRIDTENF